MTGKMLPLPGKTPGRRTSDLDLLGAAIRGHSGALRDLFYRHGNVVYRVLQQDLSLDARVIARTITATFLDVSTAADGDFCTDHSVLGRILRRAIGIHARREDAAPNPHLRMTAERAPVEALLQALPFKLRLPLVLAEREGLDEFVIAEALRTSTVNVWRRIAQARQDLRPNGAQRMGRRRFGRLGHALITGRRCPPLWRLNRALMTELVPRLDWHLSACRECAGDYAVIAETTGRLAALPKPEMSSSLRDSVAVGLLSAPRSLEYR